MKKNVVLILVILCIIVGIIFIKFNNYKMKQDEINKFNSFYENYNKDELNGLDITTVINKARSNNDKYEIPKNEEGLYILDDKYSVEIYVTMIINDTTYKMERITNLGMESFIAYFGEVGFKCTDIKYHEKTGRVASMTFEATNY